MRMVCYYSNKRKIKALVYRILINKYKYLNIIIKI